MKVLLIRLSSIGDIVLTTPVIRCLKQQLPKVEIHYLTKAKHYDLLKENPHIDHLHLFRTNLGEIIPGLREQRFDLVIDLHSSLRSQLIKSRLNVKSVSFDKLTFLKWLFVRLKINMLPPVHVVDRYMNTVAPLGVVNDGAGLDYFYSKDDEFELRDLPRFLHNGYVAVVLAGTYFTKRFPVEKHIELIGKIQHPVVLLGGKGEMYMAETIEKRFPGKAVGFCGKLTIGQSASLVKNARVVITNDTGLMHIAAAFKKKILSVWGSTVPEFGMYPYLPGPGSAMFRAEGVPCQPCSKLGKHKCPQKHFRCMNDIPEEQIAEWANREF